MEQQLRDKQVEIEEQMLRMTEAKIERDYNNSVHRKAGSETVAGMVMKKVTIDRYASKLNEYFKLKLRGKASVNREKLMYFEKNTLGLSMIVIDKVLDILMLGDVSLTKLSLEVSNHVTDVLSASLLRDNKGALYKYIEGIYEGKTKRFINRKKVNTSKRFELLVDEKSIKVSIGSILIDLLVKSGADVIEVYKPSNHDPYTVKLSDAMIRIIGNVNYNLIRTNTIYKPLVCEPLEWTGLTGSLGYYTIGYKSLIKFRNSHDRKFVMGLSNDMDRLLNVLNTVQRTKWSINSEILKVIEYIVENKLEDPSSSFTNPKYYAGIPYMDTLELEDVFDSSKFTDKNSPLYYRARDEAERRLDSIRSKRIQFLYAFNLAKEYSKYDKFYFSYQLDFRGRMYPVQQHLNPQGNDIVKAMLQFTEGVKPTEEGFKWLMIHGANVYGKDKLTYNERIQFVKEKEQEIYRIADEPISHIKTWSEADDPLLYLAFCIDYTRTKRGGCSYIPISLDATCSGIQIYSGLLRDKEGAEAVNVVNNSEGRPADIYQKVADKVNYYLEIGDYPKTIGFNNADGVHTEVSTLVEAKSMEGKITRRLTKRNTMTQPYSVTTHGMFTQIKDILSADEDDGNVWWEGDKWIVAKLLSDLNSKGIGEVVKGAKVGQDYIKSLTDICSNSNVPILWYTPYMNFPMFQNIRREKVTRVRTAFGSLKLYNRTDRIHKQKQSAGIAPNFIHALDATLMYLTVEECNNRGVKDFMLIHDSYGTNANDVSILNESVRESFVNLFKAKPLHSFYWRLPDELKTEATDPESVMINTLDLDKVKESTYIFS